MGKRRSSHPGPDYYKVQGGHVEDRDLAAMSKRALVREAARLKQKGGPLTTAPKRKRAPKPGKSEPAVVPAAVTRASDREIGRAVGREVGREFARMNERRAPRRVKRAAPVRERDYPTYLGAATRGIVRRVARMALAPFALARAVVERLRKHE
ncbi:MAG TPA: hypothetical protein VGL86_28750 [Polyangia bacterium]|jgi:hypothetical protein